jgi:ketosteroid isomerase-like protein
LNRQPGDRHLNDQMSTHTTSSSDTASLDKTLNEMILSGKALDAFERFYSDDVVMQENSDESRPGKELNRKFENEFFASLSAWHEGKLVASAVNGDISFSEWYMDISFKNGPRVQSSQVAVRTWKDGKVVHERFFYNKR